MYILGSRNIVYIKYCLYKFNTSCYLVILENRYCTKMANGTVPISSQVQVAAEQLVTIKAEVIRVWCKENTDCTPRSGYYTTIKKLNKSHLVGVMGHLTTKQHKVPLLYLKVRTNQNNRYLAKDKMSLFQVVEPFQVYLTDVDPSTETSSITGKIIAVKQITNTIACITCNKNFVACPEDDTIGVHFYRLYLHVHHIGVSE